VWSYTRHPSDREDLFQEIALALWKALPRFRGDSSVRTYIYRIAHNTAMTFVTSRHSTREDVVVDYPEPVGTTNPERDTIHNERRQRLWRSVQELPVIDRQIVLLYLEGLSSGEIEAVTGFTAGKVAMRLSRAKRRLAEQVNQAKTGRRL
jgi:RNA polymerase sigma-70 factor (ECF subfamily)